MGKAVTRIRILQPKMSKNRYARAADQTPPIGYIMDQIKIISSKILLLETSSAIIVQWIGKVSPTQIPVSTRERRKVVKLSAMAETTELKALR